MISDRINENSPWYDLTEGNKIYEAATSRQFNTGEWRTQEPVHDIQKCKECYLCVPVCPDMSILVEEDGNIAFDMDHYNMKLKNKIKPVTRGYTYLITVSMKNGESHDIYFEGSNIIGIDDKEYAMTQNIEPLIDEMYNRLGEKYEYVTG